MAFNPVVLNFGDTVLRKSDVNLLEGPHWLNDSIITFYFEYLEKVEYKDTNKLLFISPEVVQCLKAAKENELSIFLEPLSAKERKLIFMALNNLGVTDRPGGSHWSLLVYSQSEQMMYHFDSMSGANFTQAAKLAGKLLRYLSATGTGDFIEADSRQQENSYDCGIYVLCNVDLVAQHSLKADTILNSGSADESKVENMRSHVLNLIEDLKTK